MTGEWRHRPLGELTANYDNIRIPVKEADRRLGPYPYYGASGIVDHVDKYLFDGAYLLIAEDGENLRTRNTPVAFMATGKFWVNNHAHIVRGNREADTRYLMYALAITDISGYLTGSTMPKLTQGNLNRIPVIAPPLKVQQAIACTLGALDDKIEMNRHMNRTLEEIARAIFKSWFVHFDPVCAKAAGQQPPGFRPEIAALFPRSFQDSELGKIPRGWRVGMVSELADIVGGSTPSTKKPAYWEKGTHWWATPRDLSGLTTPVLLGTERRITDAGLGCISSGLLPPGTVLLSSRAPIGYLAIAQVPVAINQGFIAMKPQRGVSPHYLLRWAESSHDIIVNRANGSTFLEISKANFRPIKIVVPNESIHLAFDRLVRTIFQRVVSNEIESRSLTSLRDALLPKLISGELRVPDAERIVRRALV